MTLGGAAATNVVFASATQLTAKTSVHAAGSVDVVVTNPDTQTGTLVAGYVYLASPAPTVSAVTPTVGSKAGGAAVSITGTGFLEGATVAFGGNAGAAVVVVDATTISATAPAGTVGKVTISVTNTDLQAGSLANAFEYLDAPTLTAVDPAIGSSAGGTSLKLTGSGFVSGATVSVGGVAATSVTWVSATELTASAPAHAVGVVDIVVTNPDTQAATLVGKLTYADPPTISAVLPSAGSTEGGTEVSIVGTGFVTAVTVKFGETVASTVTLVSATAITATAPAGSTGVVSVTVTNTDGLVATLPFAFLYEAPVAAASIVNGEIPQVAGFGFIVFSGGDNDQLVAAAAATGCDETRMRFWATSSGVFIPFIPASKVQAVNAPWNALFPNGIPDNWPLIAACS